MYVNILCFLRDSLHLSEFFLLAEVLFSIFWAFSVLGFSLHSPRYFLVKGSVFNLPRFFVILGSCLQSLEILSGLGCLHHPISLDFCCIRLLPSISLDIYWSRVLPSISLDVLCLYLQGSVFNLLDIFWSGVLSISLDVFVVLGFCLQSLRNFLF